MWNASRVFQFTGVGRSETRHSLSRICHDTPELEIPSYRASAFKPMAGRCRPRWRHVVGRWLEPIGRGRIAEPASSGCTILPSSTMWSQLLPSKDLSVEGLAVVAGGRKLARAKVELLHRPTPSLH